MLPQFNIGQAAVGFDVLWLPAGTASSLHTSLLDWPQLRKRVLAQNKNRTFKCDRQVGITSVPGFLGNASLPVDPVLLSRVNDENVMFVSAY